jgi:hypothetical protein
MQDLAPSGRIGTVRMRSEHAGAVQGSRSSFRIAN